MKGGHVRQSLSAAVVGAGLMGRWHAHALTRAGHRLVAVIDPDAARAEALAARHRGARTSATLDRLAGIGPVDVIHICSPLPSHAGLVRAALELGCHVIAEKPLADNADVTASLLALAASRESLLAPVHQFLFQRGVLAAQQWMLSIGPLLHMETVACTAGAAHLPAASRDQVAMDVLPHPLSLAARFVSPALSAAEWHVRRPRAGELRADTTLNETTVSILVSTGGRPTRNAVRLIATHGTIEIDLFHGFATRLRRRDGRLGKIIRPFVASSTVFAAATGNLARRVITRETAYPGLREFIHRFYLAASTGGGAPIAATETLEVARACDRITGLAGSHQAARGAAAIEQTS